MVTIPKDIKKDYVVHSNTMNKDYKIGEACRVSNPRLQALYIRKNVEILDIFDTEDIYTGDPVVCMYFKKDERTDELYELWKKHELR